MSYRIWIHAGISFWIRDSRFDPEENKSDHMKSIRFGFNIKTTFWIQNEISVWIRKWIQSLHPKLKHRFGSNIETTVWIQNWNNGLDPKWNIGLDSKLKQRIESKIATPDWIQNWNNGLDLKLKQRFGSKIESPVRTQNLSILYDPIGFRYFDRKLTEYDNKISKILDWHQILIQNVSPNNPILHPKLNVNA